MAQIRAADIPDSMPVSRAIRDFMVAHPPTPEGQPKEELLQLLMLSVMRLEGRVVILERRSEAGTEFLEALAEIFPKQSGYMPAVGALVRCTDDSWMVRPPQRCPRGHRQHAGRA